MTTKTIDQAATFFLPYKLAYKFCVPNMYPLPSLPPSTLLFSSMSLLVSFFAADADSNDPKVNKVFDIAMYILFGVVCIALCIYILFAVIKNRHQAHVPRYVGNEEQEQEEMPGFYKSKNRLLSMDEIQELPIVSISQNQINISKCLTKKVAINKSPPGSGSMPHISSPESPLFKLVMKPPPRVYLSQASTDINLQLLHEGNCAICLDTFVAGNKVRRLPCNHRFHVSCIDPWLSQRSATCPLCNFDVAGAVDCIAVNRAIY